MFLGVIKSSLTTYQELWIVIIQSQVIASKGKDAMDDDQMQTGSESMNHEDVYMEFRNGKTMFLCLLKI